MASYLPRTMQPTRLFSLSLHASSLHFPPPPSPPPHPLTNHQPPPITHPTTPYPPLTSTAHPPSQNPQTLSNHILQFSPKTPHTTPTVASLTSSRDSEGKFLTSDQISPLLTVVVVPQLHLPFLPVGKPISKKIPHPPKPHCNTPYKQNKQTANANQKRKRPTSSPPPPLNDLLPATISQSPSPRICG